MDSLQNSRLNDALEASTNRFPFDILPYDVCTTIYCSLRDSDCITDRNNVKDAIHRTEMVMDRSDFHRRGYGTFCQRLPTSIFWIFFFSAVSPRRSRSVHSSLCVRLPEYPNRNFHLVVAPPTTAEQLHCGFVRTDYLSNQHVLFS